MALTPHSSAQLESLQTDPEAHELEYVHKVYAHIADHFSATRYKPWPIIADFLATLPPGSVGLDSGTGNGKYLPLDQGGTIRMVGLDRSLNLLQHARLAGGRVQDVVLGDAMECCWRPGAFDFAISIATIHHFSTLERRKCAVEALLRSVSRDHGRILIYVWATEQDNLSKRVVPTDPTDESKLARDVFVPWTRTSKDEKGAVHQRYYHLFEKGELRELVGEAVRAAGLRLLDIGEQGTGVEVVQEGWERSNWYIELRLSHDGDGSKPQ